MELRKRGIYLQRGREGGIDWKRDEEERGTDFLFCSGFWVFSDGC